ncbi:MAG: CidA/LrgA family protein [Negativicutes bacterium]|nr:CidA/LrgA family protein [Negativicutes bacterium]
MIRLFAVLFGFLAAGTWLAGLSGWPVPGTVIGLVLLLAALIAVPGRWAGLCRSGDEFLRHLSLFYIPAGAGIVERLTVVLHEWLALLLITVVATVAAQLIIALTMRLLLGRWATGGDGQNG